MVSGYHVIAITDNGNVMVKEGGALLNVEDGAIMTRQEFDERLPPNLIVLWNPKNGQPNSSRFGLIRSAALRQQRAGAMTPR